jgi:DNA replication protein DnaC
MTGHCEKHGDFEQQKIELLPGKSILSKCPLCVAEEEAEYHKALKAEQLEKSEKLYKDCGIPERFKDCAIDNYHVNSVDQEKAYNAVNKYIAMFDEPPVSNPLFLTGSYGTGKTHLAVAIMKHLIDKGKIRTAYYTTTMRMIRDIRSSYHHKSDSTEQEVIDRYIVKDLLVLDEVGLQNGTDNEKLLIYEVLNGRYENMSPTVLISNLPYIDLKNYLGERVIDRLKGKGGILAVFDWESERGHV